MPARPRTATVREIDLARNDRPFRIEPTAGHPGSVTALSILRQPAAKGLYNVVLEERQELLLLCGRGEAPIRAEHKSAYAGDVKICAENLSETHKSLVRRCVSN